MTIIVEITDTHEESNTLENNMRISATTIKNRESWSVPLRPCIHAEIRICKRPKKLFIATISIK